MASLYLTRQGHVLRKTGDRVVVTRKREVVLEVPCHQLDTIVLFGGVHFTAATARHLAERGIDLALLTRRGRFVCRLTSPLSKNVFLRLSQYDRAREPQFVLGFARAVVRAKLQNALALLHQHASNYGKAGVEGEVGAVERQIDRVNSATRVDELFGIEGIGARSYFEAFGKMLRVELGFEGRNRRPPVDPVNAMLSLGYSMLFKELASLAEAIGLDPYLGFFHRPEYGRQSLAADLMEEFRAPVVDRLVLRLVNLRMFGCDDFVAHRDGGATYFTREALPRFVTG